MPASILTRPAVGWAHGCRSIREGEKPPVSVHIVNGDSGWHATVNYPGSIGGTATMLMGPFASRRAAVLGLREYLRGRRIEPERAR